MNTYATSVRCIASSNRCLTTSNKKLAVTSARIYGVKICFTVYRFNDVRVECCFGRVSVSLCFGGKTSEPISLPIGITLWMPEDNIP